MGNDLLDRLESLADGGALMHGESRYLLVTLELWVDLQKAVQDQAGAEAASQAIYLSARRYGRDLADQFQQETSLSREDTIRYLAGFVRQLGWGRVEITNLDMNRGTLELEVFHSAFAEVYGKSGDPVCHALRGLFAGAWRFLMGAEVEGLETRCRAVDGPGPCLFIFAAGGRHSLEVTVSPETE